MAATKGTTAGAKKPAAAKAKAAPAPGTSDTADNSAAAPGAGASADATTKTNGSTDGAASGGSQGTAEGDADAARLLIEALGRLEDEARLMDAEFNEAALALAHEEGLALDSAFNEARASSEVLAQLHDEALAMDAARTESLETTQTTTEEGATGAVTLDVWVLPEIGEFPATVTLENHTRNRVGVPGANVVLDSYGQVEVEVSQEQYAKLAKSLTSSARAHKWDNLKGLQVKYDRKD